MGNLEGDVRLEAYKDVVASVGDEDLRVHLLTRVAQIQELGLKSDQDAVATYQSVLEISPSRVEAASAIVAVHEHNADYPARRRASGR